LVLEALSYLFTFNFFFTTGIKVPRKPRRNWRNLFPPGKEFEGIGWKEGKNAGKDSQNGGGLPNSTTQAQKHPEDLTLVRINKGFLPLITFPFNQSFPSLKGRLTNLGFPGAIYPARIPGFAGFGKPHVFGPD